MKDSILKKDTLRAALDTLNSVHTNSVPEITETSHEAFINAFSQIGIAIVILVLGWILLSYYQKYFSLRPRLVLKTGKPLYSQKIISYEVGHELTWRQMCQLKNNSQIAAYNIELWEVKRRKKRNIIDNFPAIKVVLPLNNHLDKHDQKEFEIKTTIYTAPEVLINFTVGEHGQKIIIPGIKIDNAKDVLMPKELNDVRLILKYENEKGKTFYTKFRRFKNKETNKFHRYRPYLFFSIIK
jgi:hypothetical protein